MIRSINFPAEIGMDTAMHREGLHVWVRGVAFKWDDASEMLPNASISVHLTRAQAMALVEEINRRLF